VTAPGPRVARVRRGRPWGRAFGSVPTREQSTCPCQEQLTWSSYSSRCGLVVGRRPATNHVASPHHPAAVSDGPCSGGLVRITTPAAGSEARGLPPAVGESTTRQAFWKGCFKNAKRLRLVERETLKPTASSAFSSLNAQPVQRGLFASANDRSATSAPARAWLSSSIEGGAGDHRVRNRRPCSTVSSPRIPGRCPRMQPKHHPLNLKQIPPEDSCT